MTKFKCSLTAVLFFCFLCSALPAQAGELRVIGEAQHTDIGAYINHYPIPSYAVNGTSVIVAEDLRCYGFDVNWNPETFTLTISRNPEADTITPITFKKAAVPNGTKFTDLYASDVKVLANGQELPCYSMNGYTMIPIESLSMFGEVNWVSEVRAVKLWLEGLPMTEYAPIPKEYPRLYQDYGAFSKKFDANFIDRSFEQALNNWDGVTVTGLEIAYSHQSYWINNIGTTLQALLAYVPDSEKNGIEYAINQVSNEVDSRTEALSQTSPYAEDLAMFEGGSISRVIRANCAYDAARNYAKEVFYQLYQYTGTVTFIH